MPVGADPARVKGWCPSLLRPMESGDGLIARVKPTAATLATVQARALARAAEQDGNGLLEITRRGNLQARGFDAAGHSRFASVVLEQGLAVPDPEAEAARTVLASPLSVRDDPSCIADTHHLAGEIEALLVNDPNLHRLPGKFGIAIDGGGVLPLTLTGPMAAADITVVHGGPASILIRLPIGRNNRFVEIASDPVAILSDLHTVLRALLPAFTPERRRVASVLAATDPAAVFEQLALEWWTVASGPGDGVMPRPGWVAVSDHLGVLLIAPVFGRLTADQLGRLSDIARAYGDATMRLTPWRLIVLPGIASADVAIVSAAITELGLSLDPADPRLRVSVCTGWPGCSHAETDAIADAQTLAPAVPEALGINVSGCIKGCAAQADAAVTLTGRRGCYDWIVGGRADGLSIHTGLTTHQALELLRMVTT